MQMNVSQAPSNQGTQRHLSWEGTYNVRDLGGYATQDGQHTRWHTLLRADKLDRLTAKGQQQLLDYGVRTILDLRYTPEVEMEPDVLANSPRVNYLHIPLYELNGDDGTLPAVPDDLEELYRLILDHRATQMARIIGALVEPGALPALFHCTAGKDRTGLVAALVLGALGVHSDTIVADYALSAEYLHVLFDELRRMARRNGYDSAWYDRLLLCQPEIMQHTLHYVDTHYGGARGYLLQGGMTPAQLDRLQTLLVE
jgi:protein-tyrosine phosphatase